MCHFAEEDDIKKYCIQLLVSPVCSENLNDPDKKDCEMSTFGVIQLNLDFIYQSNWRSDTRALTKQSLW